jgi:hypothetical protein
MARLVIKCACDLVIILDRAFQIGGKHATRLHIRQASFEYIQPIEYATDGVSSQSQSRKHLVHQQVNELIPAFSVLAIKIYRRKQIDTIREGISRIVAEHRMKDLAVSGTMVA